MSKVREVFKRLADVVNAGAMSPSDALKIAANAMNSGTPVTDEEEALLHYIAVKAGPPASTHYITPGQLYGGPLNAQANPVAPPKPDAYQMIGMRMRWAQHPFTKMHITNTEAGNYLVLVVIGEQHAVLEDDQAMFPSDALINKLRMMTP